MLIDVVLLVVAVVVAHIRALILDEPKFVDNRERAATTHPHAYLSLLCVRCVLPCACLDWCCLASSCFLPCLASPFPTSTSSTNKEKAGRGRKEKRKKREREPWHWRVDPSPCTVEAALGHECGDGSGREVVDSLSSRRIESEVDHLRKVARNEQSNLACR